MRISAYVLVLSVSSTLCSAVLAQFAAEPAPLANPAVFQAIRERAMSSDWAYQRLADLTDRPLLRMRGSVTVDALTAAADSVPALCFERVIWDRTLDDVDIPDSLAEDFTPINWSGPGIEARIVDVETHGRFPAEFDVDVYVPPLSAALKALAPGEPPSAFGTVCAVRPQHPALVQGTQTASNWACDVAPPYACKGHVMRALQDGSRYFSKRITCASTPDPTTCESTTEGDESLLAESGGFESVFGHAEHIKVLYLSEPAPAGSYTAYKAWAPGGLPAGYHVRKEPKSFSPDTNRENCGGGWIEEALAQTNALHGTSYDQLPSYLDDSIEDNVAAPADVIRDYERISAQLEMEMCPLASFVLETQDSRDSLAIDLKPKDTQTFEGPPPWGRPWEMPPPSEMNPP